MKANISRQGLNLADLLDPTVTTPMMTPIFNATSENSVYYNVTESILFILNATESPVNMEVYSTTTTTSTSTTSAEPSTTTTEGDVTRGTCFQIMVDCAILEKTETTAYDLPPAPTTDTAVTSEEIYDEEIIEDSVIRLKRQIGQGSVTTSTIRTTPKSIGRLLESLNSILRGLKRNSTTNPISFLNRTSLTNSEAITSPNPGSTYPLTTEAHKEISSTSSLLSTPESLEDLIRWHTAGLRSTTAEEEGDYDDNDVSSSSIFDDSALNQTDPPSYESTELPDATSTTTVLMCPLVVCPWNDTIGYFSSLTTNMPSSEEDSNSTSLCRGDNPQGCTPFWTSARDETISSVHSSFHFSTQSTGMQYNA